MQLMTCRTDTAYTNCGENNPARDNRETVSAGDVILFAACKSFSPLLINSRHIDATKTLFSFPLPCVNCSFSFLFVPLPVYYYYYDDDSCWWLLLVLMWSFPRRHAEDARARNRLRGAGVAVLPRCIQESLLRASGCKSHSVSMCCRCHRHGRLSHALCLPRAAAINGDREFAERSAILAPRLLPPGKNCHPRTDWLLDCRKVW